MMVMFDCQWDRSKIWTQMCIQGGKKGTHFNDNKKLDRKKTKKGGK